jgi:hypothetical protein
MTKMGVNASALLGGMNELCRRRTAGLRRMAHGDFTQANSWDLRRTPTERHRSCERILL